MTRREVLDRYPQFWKAQLRRPGKVGTRSRPWCMLLFRLIKLGEGRRVGWCAGCTDVRTVGLTARGGWLSKWQPERAWEREKGRENRHNWVRKGRKRDPRLSANAWNGTYSESGITIDFLPGDSMHLTSITLFIRGDKQFAEKKEDGGHAGRSCRTKLLSGIGKRRDFRKYRRVSVTRQNMRACAGICANEYINLLLGNSINLQLRSATVYTKFVLCNISIIWARLFPLFFLSVFIHLMIITTIVFSFSKV